MFNGGPGGRRGKGDEVAKNFGAAIRRMLREMKGFYFLISIAIVMSLGGSILSVIAPEKLAEITDEISAGLMIDKEKVADVSTIIMQEPTENSIINGQKVSAEDKAVFIEVMQKIQVEMAENGEVDESRAKEIYAEIGNLPESIQKLIAPEMNYALIRELAIVMGAIYLLSATLEYIEGFVMARVTAGFARNLRNRISHKINKLPLKYFDKHQISYHALRTMSIRLQVASIIHSARLSAKARCCSAQP